MTITSEKLLNRPSELHRRYGGRLAMQKSLQEKMVGGGPSNVVLTKKSIKDIEGIKVNVIKIENILKGTLAVEKKSLDTKKRQESGKRREKQEEKLETKPQAEKGPVKMPKVPRMGFLDWVKNFIGNVILGYFAVRMLDYLPKLIPIVKFLGSATDFVINTGGKLLDGLITFVDWGYKAIDATNGFIKKIGGAGAVDNFGKFVGLIDNALFLTTTIAGAMAVEALTSDSGGPGGGDAGGFRQKGIEQTLKQSDNAIMKRYFQKYGRDAFVQRFGQEGLERLPGGMVRSGLTKSARGAFVGLAGRGGAKLILGTVRPLLKRLPIIGALIDFGLSVALGESPGRAAFKAIGAGLLGSVGAAIGSVVPIAGNLIGGIVGGMAGDAIGGALYDMFFGGKNPQKKNQKVQKKAGGGITRGGKAQTGARRTIGGDKKKGKYKRALARKPSKTQFKGDPKDPLVKTGQELDKTKYFGPVLAISTKLEAKEEPTEKDYDNVGLGLNLLIAKGLEEGQLKGGLVAAFAEGGMVDDEFLEAAEKGVDVSSWISKTFRNEFETNAQKTLRLIRERKEKREGAVGVSTPETSLEGEFLPGSVPGGQLTMQQLVGLAKGAGFNENEAVIMAAIARAESGGNSNARNFKPPDKSYGLWQVNMIGGLGPARMKEFGLTSEDQLFDPVTNARAAYAIRKSQGLSAWTVYKTGAYRNFLSQAESARSAPSLRTSPSLGGTFVGGGTGSGYGTGGVKIAGDLGDYLKANRGKIGVTGSIHQHPRHPGQFRRNYFSYHNQNRALDIGGYGPAHPSSGGRDEQAPVIRALLEWNKKNGYQPVEIIHGSPAFKGLGKYESAPNALHSNHVHVAYHMGKVRSGRETIARILKDEKVFDTDTSKAFDKIDPQFAYKLNKASSKEGVIKVLQSYAGYEMPYGETEIIEVPVEVPIPMGDYQSSGGGAALIPIGIGGDNPFESLYRGG